MQTTRLKTGEIFYPSGSYENGMLGTAFALALPGDPGYDDLLKESVLADPRDEPELKRRLKRLMKQR